MTQRRRTRRPARHPAQRGVGLIEVLLAVVLLSIGFLATARMQVHGMATSQNAYALSQAKYLVLDMAERMRANREGMRNGLYAGLSTASNTSLPACVTTGTVCSAAEIVIADRHAWSQALHPDAAGAVPLLPSSDTIEASGSVALDAITGIHTVTVQWAERLDASSEARSVSVQVIDGRAP